jgi:toxin ParE1/3/4
VTYKTRPRADEDLIEGAKWICADNPPAARRFLDLAFETFGRLAEFPESAPLARLKSRRLVGARFCVFPPPFNRWMIFYRINQSEIEILRIIYGTQNWRGHPKSFFV